MYTHTAEKMPHCSRVRNIAQLKEAGHKGHRLWDSIYMKYMAQVSCGDVLGEWEFSSPSGAWVSSESEENALQIDGGVALGMY